MYLSLENMNDTKILFVDLDGTLIKEDLSNLAFIDFLKKHPFKCIFYLFVFLFKGKAFLKEKISSNFNVPFAKLTYNKSALEYVKLVKNRHRVVYLISGSHQKLVNQVHNYLKIFFESFGTKDNFNMVGINKVTFIRNKLNIHDFQYLGNSVKDIPIWNFCKNILYTNANHELKKIIVNLDLEKQEIKEDFKSY
tara:strand:- start:936 stop:1517 length:582 start_codon:yes stop_codon:yes gene_type:complete